MPVIAPDHLIPTWLSLASAGAAYQPADPTVVARMRDILNALSEADHAPLGSWDKLNTIASRAPNMPAWSTYQADPGNSGQWRSNFSDALNDPNISAQQAQKMARDLTAMTDWWAGLPGNPKPVYIDPSTRQQFGV